MKKDSRERSKHEVVQKIIGEPFMDEFPENTLKIRRNLVASSSIALIYKLSDLGINKDSSLFGVKLDGLTNEKIDIILISIITYHLVHFFWNALSHFHEWRLRLTGTASHRFTPELYDGYYEDSPKKERNSTLYNFYLEKSAAITALQASLTKLNEQIDNISQTWREDSNERTIPTKIAELRTTVANLETRLQPIDRTIVSLRRFDQWFTLFQWNQTLRWITLEFGLPIFTAITAISILTRDILNC